MGRTWATLRMAQVPPPPLIASIPSCPVGPIATLRCCGFHPWGIRFDCFVSALAAGEHRRREQARDRWIRPKLRGTPPALTVLI